MKGVITKKEVLKNPVIIIQGFGMRVFVNALFADEDATFLDIVNECNEKKEHKDMAQMNLLEIVNQFIGYELKAQELYSILSRNFKEYDDVSRFFRRISQHEEGHAIVLARVRREVNKGHYWKETKQIHMSEIKEFDKLIKSAEESVKAGISLADALTLVEVLEGSEINVVFDNLNNSVDMKSRGRFQKFFVMSQEHTGFCDKNVELFREKYNLKNKETAGK